MRRTRRFSLASLGLVGLLSLNGCVYLRLLKVKDQLQDFETNFTVGGRPSWYVEFKNPVLYAKDATFMVGAPPLSVSTTSEGVVHSYEFEMVRRATAPATVLEQTSLRLYMRGNKLWRIEAPEPFLLFFSRRVIEESLRQAKDAEIFKLEKTARATVRLSAEVEAELPSLERTRLLLGEPLDEVQEGGLRALTYRYRIIGDKRGVPIIVHLTFLPQGDLRRAVITWDSSTADATYVRE